MALTFCEPVSLPLSVVVVSFSGPAILERALGSLVAQAEEAGAEVLVVGDWGQWVGADYGPLRRRYPRVGWVDAPVGTTVPRMRSLGLSRTRGEIVALLEDDCIVCKDWCYALLDAHRSSHVAIGGAVEAGNYARSLDWSVYFCDYVRFMPPFSGEVDALCGNHVSYKRHRLVELIGQTYHEDGFYEVFVHRCLGEKGHRLLADPRLVVINVGTWSAEQLTRVPFHHGRGYAGMRVRKRSWLGQLPYLGVALLLPGVQAARIAREVLRRGRRRVEFLRALPGILCFALSWSAGEFTGYLLGPGRSVEQWR